MAEQLATADRCSYADERDEGETQSEGGGEGGRGRRWST